VTDRLAEADEVFDRKAEEPEPELSVFTGIGSFPFNSLSFFLYKPNRQAPQDLSVARVLKSDTESDNTGYTRFVEYPHDPSKPKIFSVESKKLLPFPKFGKGDNVLVNVQGSVAFGTVTSKISVCGLRSKKSEWRYRVEGKYIKTSPNSAAFHSAELEPYFQTGDFILYFDGNAEISVGVVLDPLTSEDLWSISIRVVSLLLQEPSSGVKVILKDITARRASNIVQVISSYIFEKW
jgi:hypothetical protein